MKIIKKQIRTTAHTQMLDVTAAVNDAVKNAGVKSGLAVVWVPHTTAAVTVNENADPDVKSDISREINKIVPWEDGYRHVEGNSAAHLKASLFGASETLLIEDGRLALGTWQDVYFAEFDGPRTREIWIKIFPDDPA
ncbi:secondary thiamine-phosphate synthase enzyme YjbQ [Pseudoramibacter sp.]|jgi:secondary thiamine-phosphate synthase enzyme|uniref:secondary thiamine-phosphate synthase enzyme YjbQ n=1 Tax=Pseudoramibacter sp. TaxID=2034862 RepID=UPI0025CEDBA6|nr:secondary thiamine-phosphate synthase enzyme YjbQ [Pseudoramibacter sp.]MCH4071884.1 secondary thiamine-phosphate synthase enzyme YjbQ [Pseudoramibacter sp.]MCH4105652.1 secondary thiamine-phosphate synthase enzyme YjbQ [Pseudoramibacter sp.]